MELVDGRAGLDAEGRLEAEAIPIRGEERMPAATASSAIDLQARVHELETHQVELVMQIERLCQAHAEAEARRARYEELFDFAPLGYLTLDCQGLVVEANLAAAALLGFERSSLTGQSLVGLAAPACRAGLAGFLSGVRQGPGRRSAELRIIPRSGTPIDVLLEAVLLWGREASDDIVADGTGRRHGAPFRRSAPGPSPA